MRSQHRADYDPGGLQNIANAVVIQTAKDYRKALKDIKKNPKDRKAMAIAIACEDFFDGDWITVLTAVDGRWLKEKLRKEVTGDAGD